ncbi:MAG: peptidase M22 [Acutalibacteraceae bacterium]
MKSGEKGLRQSDAVFHHTVQLHDVLRCVFENEIRPDCICASNAPCRQEGSYMPCFLVGANTAESISTVCGTPFYTTSHQHGHIVAALYSCGRLDLLDEPFIAFHLSGGTTQALLVEPDIRELFKCTVVAQSLDLKAGQAVDRVGLMLGLDFPCGPMLDKLAQRSESKNKIHPYSKNGNCSLSGIENQCRKMIDNGGSKQDVARYCIDSICASLEKMTEYLLGQYGQLPLVYSGGVMSNTIIREKISSRFPAYFASAEFSSDNAAGVAIIGYLKNK